MQFGIMSVGDVTQDPTTGHTPTEAERIEAITAIALKAEEVGLDSLPPESTTTRRSSPPRPPRTWPTSRPRPPGCGFPPPPR